MTLLATIFFPSPDGHVAVGTHGCAGPSRDVFCHLDQGILIFRVGLGDRSGWDVTLRDTCTSITLHAERWGDQTSLWTAACRRWRSDGKTILLWNRKNIIKVNQKSECLWHHKGCVCACVYFSFRCVSFLISTLFVYTPSGCHSSAPLPAQSWFNHISLCRTYSYNDDNKVYVHPAYA